MLETLKTKFRSVTQGDPTKTSSPSPSLALEIIDPSTLISMTKVLNETPNNKSHHVWSLKAQQLKLEQQQHQLTAQRDAKLRYLEEVKRQRE